MLYSQFTSFFILSGFVNRARPVRANRHASPRYTEMSEKEVRDMIAAEQQKARRAQPASAATSALQRSSAAVRIVGASVSGRVLCRRAGSAGAWTRYSSQAHLIRTLKLDSGSVNKAVRRPLANGRARVVAGWEVRPEHFGDSGASTPASAVAVALERLVRQVEVGALERDATVANAVLDLVNRTALPKASPETCAAHHPPWEK